MSFSDQTHPSSAEGFLVKDGYDTIFQNEIECWTYGLSSFPGELSAELVHRVIREMSPVFKGAVSHNFVFDLIETADLLCNACRNAVQQRDMIFSILIHLQPPYELDEESQFVLAQIIDQAEAVYGDVLDAMERKWRRQRMCAVKLD